MNNKTEIEKMFNQIKHQEEKLTYGVLKLIYKKIFRCNYNKLIGQLYFNR